MPLKHACFISYRHAQHELMRRFVEEFYEVLAGELEAQGLNLYRDLLRLAGGDFYNESLARSLCESACMVLIFTPSYFHKDHLYCTREYAAMKKLETDRLQPNAEHGLIIPVVVRSFEKLPFEILAKRQAYNFEPFLTSDARLSKNRQSCIEVRKLADYVAARYHELSELEVDCRGFTMPDDETVREMAVRLTTPRPAFPGRGALGG